MTIEQAAAALASNGKVIAKTIEIAEGCDFEGSETPRGREAMVRWMSYIEGELSPLLGHAAEPHEVLAVVQAVYAAISMMRQMIPSLLRSESN